MQEIIENYQGKLQEKWQEIQGTIAPYREINGVEEKLGEIKKIYDGKLTELQPQIMVYGIYNAGKSSIINELMRADLAPVADRPMTDSVDYYEWNGYRIADTPGVGAPIEHEEITEEHLKQADVVLFVMSMSGASERGQNYERLKNIVDSGKKVIIVLNDKTGEFGTENTANVDLMKNQIYKNMKDMRIDNDNFCIVTVNAARAKKARETGKEVFYDWSNFAELEKVILSELKKTRAFDIMRNAIREIEQPLKGIIIALKEAEDDEAVGEMQELLEKIRQQKANLRQEMQDYILGKTARMNNELPKLIWEKRTNQEEVRKVTEEYFRKICDSVGTEFDTKFADTMGDIKTELNTMETKLQAIKEKMFRQSDVGEIRIENIDIPDAVANKEALGNLDKMGLAVTAAGAALQQEAVKAGLKAAAGAIAKSFIGKTVVGKLLTSIIAAPMPPVAIILTAIGILKSIFGGSDEDPNARVAQENEYNRRKAEAEAQAQQELNQKVGYMAEDLAENLVHTVNDTIKENIGKVEDSIKENMAKNVADKNEKFAAAATLSRIHDEYDVLAVELSGVL